MIDTVTRLIATAGAIVTVPRAVHSPMAKRVNTSSSGNRRPLIIRLGKRLRPFFNRLIARSSCVPNAPVLDVDMFPWTRHLSEAWPEIRDEAEALLRDRDAIPPLGQVSPDHARIAGDSRWRSFFLVGYGYRIGKNCLLAPRTMHHISSIPGLNTAFFSILEAGCHIPRHKGVTKAILTCHLGLLVPREAEKCRMQVADQHVHWRTGECLVFDDSLYHEIWNETEEPRVVLLIQFKRPMRFPGNVIGRIFLFIVRRTAFVQEARRNLAHWGGAR